MTEPNHNSVEIEFERSANRHMLRSLTYIGVLIVIIWILTMLHIFIVDKTLMSFSCAIALVIIAIPHFICKWAGMDKGWIKYLILSSISLAIIIMGTALTYHVVIAFSLPILYAAQYRSQTPLVATYFVLVVGLYISVMGGYYVGLCDANMLLLTTGQSSIYVNIINSGAFSELVINPNPWVTLPLFFVLPRAMILWVFLMVTRFVVQERSQNAVRINELHIESETDKFTRLYNKSKFEQMVDSYYPQVNNVGVIFWDINNLKVVNDTYGHVQGDWIIGLLAGYIYSATDNRRRGYRIGGDEFVMIVENPKKVELESIVSGVAEMIAKGNDRSRVKLFAASGYAQGPGSRIHELIRQADEKMYETKHLMEADKNAGNEAGNDFINDTLFIEFASMSSKRFSFVCNLNTGEAIWSGNSVDFFGLEGVRTDSFINNCMAAIHPDDMKIFEDHVAAVHAGATSEYRHMLHIRNKDGEYVLMKCRGKVFVAEDGLTRYYMGSMTIMDEQEAASSNW